MAAESLTLLGGFSRLNVDSETSLESKKRPPMDEKKASGISRREFARRAALASAVASIAPASTLTSEPAPRATETAGHSNAAATALKSSAAEPAQANLPKLSAESQAEADARLQSILAQYGSRFSDEQKTELRRLCAVAQPPLDRLRAYAIDNGANPALYLKPLVEREKDPLASTRKGKTPTGTKKPH
jgi:hypothetical protein